MDFFVFFLLLFSRILIYQLGYWSPIYAAQDRETLVRYTLKNLIIYLFFVLLSSIIILGWVPYLRFHFAEAMRKLFIAEEFEIHDGDSISFEDIKTAADFWKYLENIVAVNLYNEYWYGWNDRIEPAKSDDQKILFENILLGVPRLRQLRVRDDSCMVYAEFKKSFMNCFDKFSLWNEDKSTFGLGTNHAWKYNKPENIFYYSGRISSYHTGGYYQDLGLTRNKTTEIIKELKTNLWITRHTRAVFLDFTVYNANINLFCIVKLVFEFPPTGGIITSSDFYPCKLIRYITKEDFIFLALEIIFIFYIVYYTFYEIKTWKYYRKKYFKIWWNYLEIIILLYCYMMIGFIIFRYFYISNQIRTALEKPHIYTSYEIVGFLNRHVNDVLAVVLFLLWIKIFRYIKLSNTLGQLNNTLSKCSGDICGFSLMFFIIFFAFAQMGYLLFGANVEKFSTFGNAALTLLITVLGEFEYYEIEASNKVLAPIFFVTYIFLVFFVLINMFIAIITDTYAEVTEEKALKRSDLEFYDFVLRAPKKIFRKCCKRPPSKKNFPGKEMMQKLKDILRMCNFSPTEIEAFYSMHNISETEDLSQDDIDHFLVNVRASIRERSKKEKPRKVFKVTMEAFVKQQETLNRLEKQINEMKEKVDTIVNTSKK